MQTEILKVRGIISEDCTDKVTGALMRVAGVDDVTVSLANRQAIIVFDEKVTTLPQLTAALASAGYDIEANGAVQESGGCCGGCGGGGSNGGGGKCG
jgi:copper chaperone CopZ